MTPGPSTWPFWLLYLFYASLLLATVSQYSPDQRLGLAFTPTSDFDILSPCAAPGPHHAQLLPDLIADAGVPNS